jgi:hypothetical protein
MAEVEEPRLSPELEGLKAVELEEERGHREREIVEGRWGEPLVGRLWCSGVRKVGSDFSSFNQRRA